MVVAQKIPLRECVDLVCGGPPCQGVSGHNMHRKQISIESDRIMEGHENNRQLDVFLKYVETLRPRFSVLENVVDIRKHTSNVEVICPGPVLNADSLRVQ